MKRTLLAACLIISMLIGSSSVFAAGKPALKEKKQVQDAGGNLRFEGINAPLIYKDKGEQKMFCDPDGKEFPDLLFSKCKHLTGDLWELDRQGEEVPESCVVKTDGTMLIPWSLCVIDVKNEHYLQVIFGEEQTDNKDEAMMYVSADMFTIGFPDDKDVLYKGRKQLFDVDGEKLLTDYVFTDPNQSFAVCGVSYIANDRENPPRVLDASGKVLADDASKLGMKKRGFYYSYKDGTAYYFDDTMKQVAESDKEGTIIGDGLLSFKGDNGLYGVMTYDGKILVEPAYQSSPELIGNGLLMTTLKDEAGNYLYGLTDKSGKVIFEPKYYSISELSEGYLYAKEQSGSKTTLLIAPDGHIVRDKIEGYPGSGLCEEVEKGKYLILNTGKILDLTGKGGIDRLGTGMISVRDEQTNLYGAYELFDGKQILEHKWEKVKSAYDCIYALKDGVWHVFSK